MSISKTDGCPVAWSADNMDISVIDFYGNSTSYSRWCRKSRLDPFSWRIECGAGFSAFRGM